MNTTLTTCGDSPISYIPLILLAFSELAPFIKKNDSCNGVIHTLLCLMKIGRRTCTIIEEEIEHTLPPSSLKAKNDDNI